MYLTEKKDSIWTRIENDCDIDELIYGAPTPTTPEDSASDR
ncbi:MAG: hypothetical protein R3Y07_03480 [Eubacteriales bacterium]